MEAEKKTSVNFLVLLVIGVVVLFAIFIFLLANSPVINLLTNQNVTPTVSPTNFPSFSITPTSPKNIDFSIEKLELRTADGFDNGDLVTQPVAGSNLFVHVYYKVEGNTDSSFVVALKLNGNFYKSVVRSTGADNGKYLFSVPYLAEEGVVNFYAVIDENNQVIETNETNNFKEAKYSVSKLNKPVSFSVTSSIINNQGVINYTLTDPDSTVSVSFYKNTTNTSFNGVQIPECQNQAPGVQKTCTFSINLYTTGTYYVYGVVLGDGANILRKYAQTSFVIVNLSPTVTPTISGSPSPTPTATHTPTLTPTFSLTPTPTKIMTPVPTLDITKNTKTPTPVLTLTPTVSENQEVVTNSQGLIFVIFGVVAMIIAAIIVVVILRLRKLAKSNTKQTSG